jgi:hypothetical protein
MAGNLEHVSSAGEVVVAVLVSCPVIRGLGKKYNWTRGVTTGRPIEGAFRVDQLERADRTE